MVRDNCSEGHPRNYCRLDPVGLLEAQANEDHRVKFSRRLKWESRPNALSVARAALEASGRRLVDLTVSNPTRAGIPYPEDLLGALTDPRSLRYEPTAVGPAAVREAVAEYYAGHGASVHPDRILLTASTSEAYHYLFKLLADPGDEILVPRPSYPLFDFLAGLELLHPVPYSLRAADPCNLASQRTRVLVTVHPNNPTGEALTASAAASLAERCATLNMALIADEVFLDYHLSGAPLQTLATLDTGNVFVLSGLSKVCGLPQMKLGWMVLAGQADSEVLERLELIADTYLSVSAPAQWASLDWLRRHREIQAPILQRIRTNSDRIAALCEGSAITYQQPKGGWTAVLELPSTVNEEVLVLRLLEEHRVLVQPGYFYDFSRGSRLVLSLLSAPEDLEYGVDRLKAVM